MILSPDFPPLRTVHETFTSHGVPSKSQALTYRSTSWFCLQAQGIASSRRRRLLVVLESLFDPTFLSPFLSTRGHSCSIPLQEVLKRFDLCLFSLGSSAYCSSTPSDSRDYHLPRPFQVPRTLSHVHPCGCLLTLGSCCSPVGWHGPVTHHGFS